MQCFLCLVSLLFGNNSKSCLTNLIVVYNKKWICRWVSNEFYLSQLQKSFGTISGWPNIGLGSVGRGLSIIIYPEVSWNKRVEIIQNIRNPWGQPNSGIDCPERPPLEVFKTQLDKSSEQLILISCFEQKAWLQISWGPFQPELFCDSNYSTQKTGAAGWHFPLSAFC